VCVVINEWTLRTAKRVTEKTNERMKLLEKSTGRSGEEGNLNVLLEYAQKPYEQDMPSQSA
jgi:hypothetical protein